MPKKKKHEKDSEKEFHDLVNSKKQEQEEEEEPTTEEEKISEEISEGDVGEFITEFALPSETETSFVPEEIEDKEIEEILGIPIASARTVLSGQTQDYVRPRTEKGKTEETSYTSRETQPFYGAATEYNPEYQQTYEPESQPVQPIREGTGLERIMPLSNEMRRETRLTELEFTPSFDTSMPVEELFLTPVGESYFKKEEEIRRKRVRRR